MTKLKRAPFIRVEHTTGEGFDFFRWDDESKRYVKLYTHPISNGIRSYIDEEHLVSFEVTKYY